MSAENSFEYYTLPHDALWDFSENTQPEREETLQVEKDDKSNGSDLQPISLELPAAQVEKDSNSNGSDLQPISLELPAAQVSAYKYDDPEDILSCCECPLPSLRNPFKCEECGHPNLRFIQMATRVANIVLLQHFVYDYCDKKRNGRRRLPQKYRYCKECQGRFLRRRLGTAPRHFRASLEKEILDFLLRKNDFHPDEDSTIAAGQILVHHWMDQNTGFYERRVRHLNGGADGHFGCLLKETFKTYFKKAVLRNGVFQMESIVQ